MANCLKVQLESEAYLDGELDPARATYLERHLAECDECRAELARLQAVVEALETWPLVSEPAGLTARVMAHVRSRPALPRFRLRWSDLAISLAGSGLVFVVMLLWHYLSSADRTSLYRLQMYLQLDMLRLEAKLWIQHLIENGTVVWGLLSLVGVALIIAITFAMLEQEVLAVRGPGQYS